MVPPLLYKIYKSCRIKVPAPDIVSLCNHGIITESNQLERQVAQISMGAATNQ